MSRIRAGDLTDQDWVWRLGWPDWRRVADAPFPSAQHDKPLASLRHWMTLTSALLLVAGLAGCMTLVGGLAGLFFILCSFALKAAAAALPDGVAPEEQPFFDRLARFMRLLAWGLLIVLLSVLFVGGYFWGLSRGISNAAGF